MLTIGLSEVVVHGSVPVVRIIGLSPTRTNVIDATIGEWDCIVHPRRTESQLGVRCEVGISGVDKSAQIRIETVVYRVWSRMVLRSSFVSPRLHRESRYGQEKCVVATQ